MFHNFTFEEDGNLHYIQWNPTSVDFGRRERTVFEPLDGPPVIHFQDTTEVFGTFTWENLPVYKREPYEQIEDLVGKSGVIYTNEMPQLVGHKNDLTSSHLGDVLDSGNPWVVGLGATYESTGTVYGPDGVSLVDLYKTTAGSTSKGRFETNGHPEFTFKKHTVLSCAVKYGNSVTARLELYKDAATTYTHFAEFFLNPATDGISVLPGDTCSNCGAFPIAGTDNWWRIWCYVDSVNSGSGSDVEGASFLPYVYSSNAWGSGQTIGNYITDIQIEHGVNKPTWFAATDGASINEQMFVEFLDMETEYQNNPGVVKHTVKLHFKLKGEWL